MADEFDRRIKAESKPMAIIGQMIKDKINPPAKSSQAAPPPPEFVPGAQRAKTLDDAEKQALGYKRGGVVSKSGGFRPMTTSMQRKSGGRC